MDYYSCTNRTVTTTTASTNKEELERLDELKTSHLANFSLTLEE